MNRTAVRTIVATLATITIIATGFVTGVVRVHAKAYDNREGDIPSLVVTASRSGSTDLSYDRTCGDIPAVTVTVTR